MSNPFEENRRLDQNAALRRAFAAEIAGFEVAANTSADRMLKRTAVNIEMDDLIGPFHPPSSVVEIFEATSSPVPASIESLKLDLTYDRATRHFSVTRGNVLFYNGYGIRVTDPFQRDNEGTLTYHNLYFYTARSDNDIRERLIARWTTRRVQGFFGQCGVTLPMEPLEASWDVVTPTLAMARHSVITAEEASRLDDDHDLVIAEQIVQANPVIEPEDLQTQNSAWLRGSSYFTPSTGRPTLPFNEGPKSLRELSVQVVNYAEIAAKSIEAVFWSTDPVQHPKFKGIFTHAGIRQLKAPGTSSRPLDDLNIEAPEGEIVPSGKLRQYVQFMMHALEVARNKN